MSRKAQWATTIPSVTRVRPTTNQWQWLSCLLLSTFRENNWSIEVLWWEELSRVWQGRVSKSEMLTQDERWGTFWVGDYKNLLSLLIITGLSWGHYWTDVQVPFTSMEGGDLIDLFTYARNFSRQGKANGGKRIVETSQRDKFSSQAFFLPSNGKSHNFCYHGQVFNFRPSSRSKPNCLIAIVNSTQKIQVRKQKIEGLAGYFLE